MQQLEEQLDLMKENMERMQEKMERLNNTVVAVFEYSKQIFHDTASMIKYSSKLATDQAKNLKKAEVMIRSITDDDEEPQQVDFLSRKKEGKILKEQRLPKTAPRRARNITSAEKEEESSDDGALS